MRIITLLYCLAASRQIIEMFGGTLELQVLPEENETRFIVDLPICSSSPRGCLPELYPSECSHETSAQAAIRTCYRGSAKPGLQRLSKESDRHSFAIRAADTDIGPESMPVPSVKRRSVASGADSIRLCEELQNKSDEVNANADESPTRGTKNLRDWALQDSLSSLAGGLSSILPKQQSPSLAFEKQRGPSTADETKVNGPEYNCVVSSSFTPNGEVDISQTIGPEPVALPILMGRQTYESGKALIVDDVLSNRKVLLRHMRKLFGHIDEAEDGVQAVNCVKRATEQGSPYDVIFIDFVMPNMDGPTATAEIRRMGFKGPIFGVTGNALTSDIQLFIERGANNVFLKPVDMNALDRALRGKVLATFFIVLTSSSFFTTAMQNISNDLIMWRCKLCSLLELFTIPELY